MLLSTISECKRFVSYMNNHSGGNTIPTRIPTHVGNSGVDGIWKVSLTSLDFYPFHRWQ